jgi:uncharacterized protein YndB with AHSA1/START domain
MRKNNLTAEPGKQEIIITEEFSAPCDLVFKIYTDPILIPEWWGPGYLTTTVEKMDVKPGGQWRFIQRAPDGQVHAFHGVYHEVVPAKKLVQTFEYEGMPGHVILETLTFEDQDGKTKLTDQSVFQSVEDRDGMLNSGMQEGSDESMDRLVEILNKHLV